jgi:hypothetical protein
MHKPRILWIFAALVSMCMAQTASAGKIGVIVNKDIYANIKSAVTQYINDIQTIEHKPVWVDTTTFDTGFGRPKLQRLRDSLIQRFFRSKGCFFTAAFCIFGFKAEGTVSK